MEPYGSIDSNGDEYTMLLNEWCPIGIVDDSSKWKVWDTIQRLVDDARRYRTRALVAEEEVQRGRSEWNRVECAVSDALSGLRDLFSDDGDGE